MARGKAKDVKPYWQPERIVIDEGQQNILQMPKTPIRIAVGDPEVADVALTTTPRELLITGIKQGTTDLHIWTRQSAEPIKYLLKINPRTIAGEFEALTAHAGEVQAQEVDPRDVTEVDVGGTQIQTDIKVVEISRTALKEAGMGFLINTSSGNTRVISGSPGTLEAAEKATSDIDAGSLLLSSAAGFFPYAQAYQMVVGNSGQGWLSSVSLLEQGGYAYTLAEPSLVVMSGQTANFLAGGEYPIPVAQGGNVAGAVTVDYRSYGVRLALTPTLLAANRIMMKVAPEVSDLDYSAGILSNGTRVPALKVRRTDTSIELGDGESFVISGLISQTTIANEDKFPWLGDLPYIGAFFRSKSFEKNDKELLMVVTPHIVHPLRKDAALPPLPGEAYRRTNPSFETFMFNKQEPSRPQHGSMEGFSR